VSGCSQQIGREKGLEHFSVLKPGDLSVTRVQVLFFFPLYYLRLYLSLAFLSFSLDLQLQLIHVTWRSNYSRRSALWDRSSLTKIARDRQDASLARRTSSRFSFRDCMYRNDDFLSVMTPADPASQSSRGTHYTTVQLMTNVSSLNNGGARVWSITNALAASYIHQDSFIVEICWIAMHKLIPNLIHGTDRRASLLAPIMWRGSTLANVKSTSYTGPAGLLHTYNDKVLDDVRRTATTETLAIDYIIAWRNSERITRECKLINHNRLRAFYIACSSSCFVCVNQH